MKSADSILFDIFLSRFKFENVWTCLNHGVWTFLRSLNDFDFEIFWTIPKYLFRLLSCIHICTLSKWLWSDRHFFRPVNCYVLCLKLCVLLKNFFGSLASLSPFRYLNQKWPCFARIIFRIYPFQPKVNELKL